MSLPRLRPKDRLAPQQLMAKFFASEDEDEQRIKEQLLREEQEQPRVLMRRAESQPRSQRQRVQLKRPSKIIREKIELAKEKLSSQDEVNKKFYSLYKAREINTNDQNQPLALLLQEINRLNVLPRKLSLLGSGHSRQINLRQMGVGQAANLQIISKFIKSVPRLAKVDLSYNSITAQNAQLLLASLNQAESVDLSFNSIGAQGALLLGRMFRQDDMTKIRSLSLESNLIGDAAGQTLINAIKSYDQLRLLNLTKCGLHYKTASAFKEYLAKTITLQELYLGWNDLSARCLGVLSEGLSKNQSLRVLDLSWNSLGGNQYSVGLFGQFLRLNKMLLHLDLSYCDFQFDECHLLRGSLSANHTLFGIHMEGNAAYADFRGDLVIIRSHVPHYPLPSRKLPRIQGVRPCREMRQAFEESCRGVCWICDCWQEVTFRVNREEAPEQCFINLQHEGFRNVRMGLNENGEYQIKRMCPLGKLRYFFTRGKGKYFASQSHKTCGGVRLKNVKIGKEVIASLQIKKLNFFEGVEEEQILSSDYQPFVECRPRIFQPDQEPKVTILKIKKQKPPRTFELDLPKFNRNSSLFKDWRELDQEFMRRCLQFDLKHNKIMKLFQGKCDQLFERLLREYALFIKANYMLAAETSQSNNFFISLASLRVFNEACRFQSLKMTIPKLHLKFKASVAKTDDPDSELRNMNRPFFLEYLVRVAHQKFCQKNVLALIAEERLGLLKKTSISISSRRSLSLHLREDHEQSSPKKLISLEEALPKTFRRMLRYVQDGDPQIWRKQYLWTSIMSLMLQRYDTFIRSLYWKYVGKLIPQFREKGLFLCEFKAIFLQAKLLQKKDLVQNQILQKNFLLSKMIEVEDIFIKVPKLNYLQFYQALCRMADHLSIAFPGTLLDSLTPFQKRNLPLFFKAQALLGVLYAFNQEFKSRRLSNMVKRRMFDDRTLQVYVQKFKGAQEQQKSKIKINRMQQKASKRPTLPEIISVLKDQLEQEDLLNEDFQEVQI